MWVFRSPEERERWAAKTKSGARSFALLVFIGTSVLLTMALGLGISTTSQLQMDAGTGTRPMGWGMALVIGLAAGAGIAREAWRWKMKGDKECTVCPACGTLGENNEGQACGCGGAFVKSSDVRWVDDEPAPEASEV